MGACELESGDAALAVIPIRKMTIGIVEYAAAHIQHMQKALMEMNLQLHHVVTDITGATGMRIIRAIVAGERNPDVLATYRDVRCHSSIETIRAALVGNDRHEHVFALPQSLELYDVYQAKMLDCDRGSGRGPEQ
jgi:transposase